jgi:hypothetical protein
LHEDFEGKRCLRETKTRLGIVAEGSTPADKNGEHVRPETDLLGL